MMMGLHLMAHLDQDVQPFPPLAKGFACLTIDVNMQGCCDTNDSSEPDYGHSIYLFVFLLDKGVPHRRNCIQISKWSSRSCSPHDT